MSFGSLLGPPVAPAINANGTKGDDDVEQTLPDSPPDSSGSPPSSVYSPAEIRHQQQQSQQPRKRRRNSDEDGVGLDTAPGTVLCDLMLGESLKDDEKDAARYSVPGGPLIAMGTQCPYMTAQDDIKPSLMIPTVVVANSAIPMSQEGFQSPGAHNTNYHQLTAAQSAGYYINYVDFDAEHSYNNGGAGKIEI